MTSNGVQRPAFRYVAYRNIDGQITRIGHLDESKREIQPLAYKSGAPFHNLYQVISAGAGNVIELGAPVSVNEVQLLPPISGRDILAVGKNYAEHATEFNSSGYDSSDKVDQPTHPVIFTKRSTSIIAHGDDIYPHLDFTESLDYEGELGVIIGKPGFQIAKESAMDHVWGYTIINDVTAREKQRDHKQFYIGKSADTFCPIGPVAVAKEHLPRVMEVTTLVNGEQRQQATTDNLIFDVATLVSTCSAGQTMQIGDTIATGTPAGVGFGFKPPKWLQPGDEVEVRITGLGSLKNRVANATSKNPVARQIEETSYAETYNNKVPGEGGLFMATVNRKRRFWQVEGGGDETPILFIHGLGASSEFFRPLAQQYQGIHALHLYDLEGHGLSPTLASSHLSIDSFTKDAEDMCSSAKIRSGLTVIAHSMGCLIALSLAIRNPDLISKLVLMGPPPSPLPSAGASGALQRAATVREKGMSAVAASVAAAGTSANTQKKNPIAYAAVKISLLGQDAEGYAKACTALAESSNQTLSVGDIQAKTLILTGAEDKVSPPSVCEDFRGRMPNCEQVVVLPDVGHWHLFEDFAGVSAAVNAFI